MRVVFMGTPDFSVPTLEHIVEAGHEVVGVVTQPDKPKGRGNEVIFSAVKVKAMELGIPVYQPVKVKEAGFLEELTRMQPDIIVVIAFGQILSKAVLDLPKYGCINVHASLLPKYRGSAPIQWTIIDGEKVTGVTTMFMDVGIDTGDMLKKVEVPIEDDETGQTLHDKLSVAGAKLLVETLVELQDGTAIRQKQDDSLSNYVSILTKSIGSIDFSKSAVEIERLIRGLNPWPSAYTSLNGKTLKIWSAKVMDMDADGENGQIIDVTKDAILVKTGNGILALKEIQLEGKKRMTVDAFLRGFSIEKGIVLADK
jgi:methionyl-tRNA formyltransferase